MCNSLQFHVANVLIIFDMRIAVANFSPSTTPFTMFVLPFFLVFLFFEDVLATQDIESVDESQHAVLIDAVMA